MSLTEESVADRFDSWLEEFGKHRPRRRKARTKRRLTALSRPRSIAVARQTSPAVAFGRSLEWSTRTRTNLNRTSTRSAHNAEAYCEDEEPGHALWGLVARRQKTPPTLALVCAEDEVFLTWQDAKSTISWRWEGEEWSSDLDVPTERMAESIFFGSGAAVVKVSPSARSTELAQTIEKECSGGLVTGASKTTGHAISVVENLALVRKLVSLLISSELSRGSVLIQGYVKPRGPFVVRAKATKKMCSGWIVSNRSGPSSEDSIVRISSTGWEGPKALAKQILDEDCGLELIVADYIQDREGSWWLLQIKAFRGRPTKKRRVAYRQSGEIKAPSHFACQGEFCDFPIPTEHHHVYGDNRLRGAVYTIPRTTLLDHPRSKKAVGGLASMSRRDRLAFYTSIVVCANCHFEYVGRLRVPQKKTTTTTKKKLPPVTERRRRTSSSVDWTCSEFSTTPEAECGSPLEALSSPKVKISCAPSSAPSFLEEDVEPNGDGASASVLRSAITDVDEIHRRAVEQMEHTMRSNVTASVFLSSIDKALEEAEARGRRNQLQENGAEST